MQSFRRFALNRPALAALLLALALFMRLLFPAGTMLSPQSTVLTVTICNDATQGPQVREMVIPMAPKSGGQSGGHSKDGGGCSFGALSMALMGADPILLALAFAFIVALGLGTAAPFRVVAMDRLRPPLRGPPVPA